MLLQYQGWLNVVKVARRRECVLYREFEGSGTIRDPRILSAFYFRIHI
jgi:hypothetical protein